ncbi:MAG: cation transporting ATPase C-terminal domain-containing protein [Flammeovirgaceae bacterium]
MFFNVFVLLQVFNEINARKLKSDEVNVFENFFNNKLFLVIVVSTIIIQLTMVKYGGKSLKTV